MKRLQKHAEKELVKIWLETVSPIITDSTESEYDLEASVDTLPEAIQWCKDHNYEYKIMDDGTFTNKYMNSPVLIKKDNYKGQEYYEAFLIDVDKIVPVKETSWFSDESQEQQLEEMKAYFDKWGFNYTIEE